jgi:hypothetical protein
MATVMAMTWEGVTPEQYDAVMDKLALDENPLDGGRFHLCGFDGGAMRVVDVWDSQEAFESAMGSRIQGAVQEVGIQGEPQVEFYEAHNAWAPQGKEARAVAG